MRQWRQINIFAKKPKIDTKNRKKCIQVNVKNFQKIAITYLKQLDRLVVVRINSQYIILASNTEVWHICFGRGLNRTNAVFMLLESLVMFWTLNSRRTEWIFVNSELCGNSHLYSLRIYSTFFHLDRLVPLCKINQFRPLLKLLLLSCNIMSKNIRT